MSAAGAKTLKRRTEYKFVFLVFENLSSIFKVVDSILLFYIESFRVKILKDVSSLVVLRGEQLDVICYSKRTFLEEVKQH